ncbi:MAG: HD domain-containing protein [Desulfobacterales bacterium]|nr:MAG: HD domain-containing protein [Desulfobacterales bacterium]
MMIPMFTEENCLKCHIPSEKNKVGEIRGGLDISVPLQKFAEMTQDILFHTYGGLSLMWLLGTGAIIVASRVTRKKALALHAKELEKIKNYQSMISLVVDLIDKRDSYTAGHSHRVSQYCELIARAMSHDEAEVRKIDEAAVLHDVGKIAIPDSILLKPGHLTPVEKELINYHLTAGYELLAKVDVYHELGEIIRHHHERYDGSGYPEGLSGDQIHPLARIMIVADAFDAMTTDRIYKPRKSVEDALKEIEAQKGHHFDPEVVDAAIAALRHVEIKAFDQLPKTEIEKERFAYYFKDQLTGLNNHWALESILQMNQQSHEYRFATVIKLENLANFNRQNGWHKGNVLLNKFGTALKNRYPHQHMYRIFGDTFVILNQYFFALAPESLTTAEFFRETNVSPTLTVINLIKEKIDSISQLEEIINTKSLKLAEAGRNYRRKTWGSGLEI